MSPRRFNKPVPMPPEVMAELLESEDPALRAEVADRTAELLVTAGRGADPGQLARLVHLADEHGIEIVADVWATAAPTSQAGALWRLYAIRSWVVVHREAASVAYRDGRARGGIAPVVAGVAEPPTPEEVVATVDDILRGAFVGDFAVALERAAAFCRVVARGWAEQADRDESVRPDRYSRLTSSAAALTDTAGTLVAAAAATRARAARG